MQVCACVFAHAPACTRGCVRRRRQNQSHQFSGVFPARPLLLITIDLAVIVYFLFLSFVCHQLHMVVVCINSYVVHICVCNLSSLISVQSQQKGMFRMLLEAVPSLPSGYRKLVIFSHACAITALLNAARRNHQPPHAHATPNLPSPLAVLTREQKKTLQCDIVKRKSITL